MRHGILVFALLGMVLAIPNAGNAIVGRTLFVGEAPKKQ